MSAENGLPQIAPLVKGERVMPERNTLDTFYRQLQVPSRIGIEIKASNSQIEEHVSKFRFFDRGCPSLEKGHEVDFDRSP